MLLRYVRCCCPLLRSDEQRREDPSQSLLAAASAAQVQPSLSSVTATASPMRSPSPLIIRPQLQQSAPPATACALCAGGPATAALATGDSAAPACAATTTPAAAAAASPASTASADAFSKPCSSDGFSKGRASPSSAPGTVASLEMYNSLIGKTTTAAAKAEAPAHAAELNTETCAICCDEIVLGPHHLVIEMKLPPGEAPRHFECGHALHADCFAEYTASHGRACPICKIESSAAPSPAPSPRRRLQRPGAESAAARAGSREQLGFSSPEAARQQLEAWGFGADALDLMVERRQQ